MPRSKFLPALVGTTLVMGMGIAEAQAQFWPTRPPSEYLYSIDIGSDWDFSDPAPGPAPGVLDAGNVYQGAPDPASGLPILYKEDDFQTDGIDVRVPVWVDVPFSSASNPPPGAVPVPGSAPNIQNYFEYYDLDAEDQLNFNVEQFQDSSSGLYIVDPALVGFGAATGLWQANSGNPGNIVISFDDDLAPGWTSGDVPTSVSPDRAVETYETTSDYLPKTPLFAAPAPLPDKDEDMLVLPPNPGLFEDDDVDALDWIPFLPADPQATPRLDHRYHSPDHEGVFGPGGPLDPGDIYLTVNGIGSPNIAPVFDDVINFGLLDDTDVDAFEFVALTIEEYEQLFDQAPVAPGSMILAGLFSVDEDDPDTTGADESGGLSPYAVYITNFAGANVAITDNFGFFDEDLQEFVGDDIDAITIPEPASVLLIGLGALAMIRRRRA